MVSRRRWEPRWDREGRRGSARPTAPSSLTAVLCLLLSTLLLPACSDSSGPKLKGVPATLEAVAGQGLSAPAGTVLPEGPTVRVRDGKGDPVPDVTVQFTVEAGGGQAVLPQVTTDGSGRARSTWILGSDVGAAQRLRASVGELSVTFEAQAIAPVPGKSYLGRRGYVEYFPGELPVVLSAPHGGDLEPSEISDRTYGTLGGDRNVRDLALRVRQALHALTGRYPHVVVSHLARVKLDPNREIVEAAQGDAEAERAWWEYHTFIEVAERWVTESRGEGLYIDLHGHGHEIQRLELGYLLPSSDLAQPVGALDAAQYLAKSSMRALGSKPGVSFDALIRGPLSLGALMEAEGYPAVPSPSQPDPGGNPFFSGGYSTARHGSRDGGEISGLQIECNYTGVRDTSANRQAFAEALARALELFFAAHFESGLRGAGADGGADGGRVDFPFQPAA